jgi:hypothetical protein
MSAQLANADSYHLTLTVRNACRNDLGTVARYTDSVTKETGE